MNIEDWLHGIGMAQYAEQFRSNEIDGEILLRLSSDDLKDIGVAPLGHRKKLLDAIAALVKMSASPAAPVAPASHPCEAERRQLTVMFVDLVGSTELSTRLDPEDMRELMRSYQNTVAGEIARFEGHVAQFLGDGVLAYFGWPRAHEDEAERAVRAALAVTAATARLKTPTGDTLQTRIGIATGRVVVGDLIGEGSGQRHAVVGETPNLAARLQGMAEPGTVVIAEATRHLLGDLFLLRELGPQQFKGIAEPTPAYAVLGERALETRFAARHAGGVTPLVGRDQELALLIERWQQAKAGEGQVVLLSGEAGIGKSRIAEAVVDAVRGQAHYLVRYQCSPYHSDSALYPVLQQIGRSFDHRGIAALSALPEAELADAMQRLVEAELIFRRGTAPEATYLFKHALVRDAAYESLLKARRVTLHGRMLEILEASGDAAPEVMAQHAEVAGMTDMALDYWEQAGTQAQARPAYEEAIASFGNAIRLCRAMGDELQWKRREQGLQMQMWQAQIANHGYSAPATVGTAERALALADEIGDVALQIPALYGQWVAHYVGGRRADELAQRFAALVDAESESGPRLVGLRVLGLERFHEGRFRDSLVFMEKAIDGYDPIAHRDLGLRFGVDPRAAAAGYRTWNIWHLGFPDQAVRAGESNLRWAREVDHVNTTGHVLCIGSLTNIWLRRPDRVESAAREMLRLAEERSLALWHAWALICLGWALS